MTGVLSPRGYRVRVTADQATSPVYEATIAEKREAKRQASREVRALGLGARAEILAGPNLNAGLWAARMVRGKNGKPKLLVEPTPGMKGPHVKRLVKRPAKVAKKVAKKVVKK